MKATILIVEDEGILALGLKKRLEKLGYVVPTIASSGDEAIELAANTKPDLILMDIVLKGGMDGIEAAERISASLRVPIIYLTAYSDEETVKRAKVTEPFGYIVKPYDNKELQIAVEMALHKDAMEKLRESHHWLETVLRSISDAVITTDKNGKVTFMNPAAEKLIGLKLKKASGESLENLFAVIDEVTRSTDKDLVRNVLKKNSVIASSGNLSIIPMDGGEVSTSYSASPIADDQGNVMGVVLILKDLTSQREVEAESKIREMAMASSINALCMTDLHGIIKHANSQFCRFWECGEDVLGSRAFEVCGLESKCSDIEASLRYEGIWAGETSSRKKDGKDRFIRLSANTIRDRLGRPISIMYSFVDITDLKKAKGELRNYLGKLIKIDDKTDKIEEDLSQNFELAERSMERLSVILSEHSDGNRGSEAVRCLELTKDAMNRTGSLLDELLKSSLPLSFYILLINLYQIKIDDFSNSKEI